MADNTTLDSGTGGDVIATDDIAGVKHQRVKVQYGDDGSATDVSDTNPLPVDDAGGSLTVDGTVTANLSATDNAVLDNIDSDTSNIQTAVELIDDAVVADDAAFTPATTKVMMAGYEYDDTTPDSVDEGDGGAARMSANRNVYTQIRDAAGNERGVNVNSSNELLVDEPNTVSTNNSTTSTLGISGNYTGTGDDVSNYAAISVQTDSSHDSATDGLTFEFSTDNSNWDDVYTFTYTAADGARRFVFPASAQYFRVNYTNGGTGQTHFRLQTILHKMPIGGVVQRISDNIKSDTAASLVTSAIVAQASGSGDFVPVSANAGGKLQVAADVTGDATDGSAHGASQTGVRAMGTDGTNDQQIAVDSSGNVQADIVSALPAGTNAIGKLAANSGVDIGDVDVLSLPASTNTIEVVGDVAHDAAASGNPILTAGVAQDVDDTAPPNRVSTESDATQIATDFDGAVFARPHGPQIWSYHVDGSSALTDATVHAAPGANLSLYVTDIIISSGAATAINVFFEESTTTVLGPYYLEAVAGRGAVIRFSTPKKITANTALTVTSSAAIAHSIDVTGYVGQG